MRKSGPFVYSVEPRITGAIVCYTLAIALQQADEGCAPPTSKGSASLCAESSALLAAAAAAGPAYAGSPSWFVLDGSIAFGAPLQRCPDTVLEKRGQL